MVTICGKYLLNVCYTFNTTSYTAMEQAFIPCLVREYKHKHNNGCDSLPKLIQTFSVTQCVSSGCSKQLDFYVVLYYFSSACSAQWLLSLVWNTLQNQVELKPAESLTLWKADALAQFCFLHTMQYELTERSDKCVILTEQN